MIRRPALQKMSMNTGPNMTPMVDIVMCILIFFMLSMEITGSEKFLTSNLAVTQGPGVFVKPDIAVPSVRFPIDIKLDDKDGVVVYAFRQRVTDLDGGLAKLFAEKHADMSDDVQILIHWYKGVQVQDFIKVYDQCTKAQFKNVAFMLTTQ